MVGKALGGGHYQNKGLAQGKVELSATLVPVTPSPKVLTSCNNWLHFFPRDTQWMLVKYHGEKETEKIRPFNN